MRNIMTGAGAVFLSLFFMNAYAEESPHQVTGNVAILSDYLYRGISQTSEHPALQGGIDYAYTPYGFYIGGWGSNVDFAGSLELNLYGGFAGEFSNGITWDTGGLYCIYPGSNAEPEENFAEVYFHTGYTFDMTYEPALGAGVAYSPDFFGEDGDAVYVYGSLDFSLPLDIGLSFYVAHQDVQGDQTTGPMGFNYTHYSISLSKALGPLELAGSWNEADTDCGGEVCEAFVVSVSAGF